MGKHGEYDLIMIIAENSLFFFFLSDITFPLG